MAARDTGSQHRRDRVARRLGGLSVYASHFGSYDKSWGSLSAVVVTLLWLWLTSAAPFFGAEVDAEAQRLGSRRRPGAEDPSA